MSRGYLNVRDNSFLHLETCQPQRGPRNGPGSHRGQAGPCPSLSSLFPGHQREQEPTVHLDPSPPGPPCLESGLFFFAFWMFISLFELVGSYVAAHRFSSCSSPEFAGSVVAVCGLRCSVACGILVPWPGIEPSSPALQGGFLTGPPGKSHESRLFPEACVHLSTSEGEEEPPTLCED